MLWDSPPTIDQLEQSRQAMALASASWTRLRTKKHDRHTNSSERHGATRRGRRRRAASAPARCAGPHCRRLVASSCPRRPRAAPGGRAGPGRGSPRGPRPRSRPRTRRRRRRSTPGRPRAQGRRWRSAAGRCRSLSSSPSDRRHRRPRGQDFEGILESVLVHVLLEEVLVVELLLEDGLVVELGDGQLLGGFEVELPSVKWASTGSRCLSASLMARIPPCRVRLGGDRGPGRVAIAFCHQHRTLEAPVQGLFCPGTSDLSEPMRLTHSPLNVEIGAIYVVKGTGCAPVARQSHGDRRRQRRASWVCRSPTDDHDASMPDQSQWRRLKMRYRVDEVANMSAMAKTYP